VKKDHEKVVTGSEPISMIVLNPYTYCTVLNPVMKDGKDNIITDEHNQAKLRHGDAEIRTSMDYIEPFPLYPGEQLGQSDNLPMIQRDKALRYVLFLNDVRLEANRDFTDETNTKRRAGEEWMIKGPQIYIPKVEVHIREEVAPKVIGKNSALKVRAIRKTKDSNGAERQAGEEWLIDTAGFYLPGVDEEVVNEVLAQILDE
jgi:major vault protein